MKWFKFETEEQQYREHEPDGMLIYLGPEALKHAIVVNDFEVFQSSPECVPGGRLLEVSRQFSYRLRQVADLVEEPMDRKAEVDPEQTSSRKEPFSQEILQASESSQGNEDQENVDNPELTSPRTERNVESISKSRKVLKFS